MEGVSDNTNARRGLLARVLARVGNPLEWSLVDKALLVCAATLGFAIDYAIVCERLLANPESAPYADRAVLGAVGIGMWIVAACWALLTVIGVLLRKNSPGSRLYSSACLQFLALTDGVVCYLLGPWTSPFAFALVLAAGVVGFLLFERAQMLWALATFGVILFGTTAAEQLGRIPHAPILTAPPIVDGKVDLAWVLTIGGLSTLTAAAALAIADYLIRSWRGREEKLAEAYVLLREQQDQLVRAESLAAIGSLVTGAAHELRNPLGASSALFQSLREELEGSASLAQSEKDDALETLEMALRGQRRAATIAERLYSLSDSLARGAGERALGEVLDASAADHPEVTIEAADAARAARMGERALYTIVQNLIANALAAGGAPVRIQAQMEGPFAVIRVRDAGPGIAEALRAEVFKPFVTGDKTSRGEHVGLGLYIVHELARQMGGTAELGAPESGAEVIVRLPAGEGQGAKPPAL